MLNPVKENILALNLKEELSPKSEALQRQYIKHLVSME